MTKYRLRGGRLILGDSIAEGDLLISGGVIDGIIKAEDTAEGYTDVDCNGLYVSPGFIDIHQHGGGGYDYMDDHPDTCLAATEAHLRHGTTAVMPTLLSAEKNSLIRAVNSYKRALSDPRIRASLLGIHVEGPYISPAHAGAQDPTKIRGFIPSEYGEIFAAAEGCIARWSVAPELSGAEEFAAEATKRGVTLSIAHSNADLDLVKKAYEWGFRHVTHLYSCMSTITRRGGFRVPGVLEATYLLDGMNVEIIADGCHLPQPLLEYVMKFKATDRISIITDAMRAAGQNVTESFLGAMDDSPLPVVIEDGVAKLPDRTAFAGSIATADRLVRTMVSAGASLTDAVKMMTVNPLNSMGLSVKKGVLAEGYDADVCIFDEDVNVKRVFARGVMINA